MLYQAIQTKYLGPTNTLGARIKATAQCGSVTVPYDHSLGAEGNHRAAAMKLAAKYEWEGAWVGGGSADGRGFSFVRCEASTPAFTVTVQRSENGVHTASVITHHGHPSYVARDGVHDALVKAQEAWDRYTELAFNRG